MSARLIALTSVALTFFASMALAEDPTLVIGSPAPKLSVKEFVKGEPVKQFDKDKIYVVEFWATWCAPCRTSIPHLTALQKLYPKATFIGVSVFEEEPSEVAGFVKEMGEKMDYRVATDSVPEKADARDGKMATDWMKAAKRPASPRHLSSMAKASSPGLAIRAAWTNRSNRS